MSGRINCCIPFCKRTASAAKFSACEEIICGKCWKLVSPKTKAVRALLRRRSKRIDRLLMRPAILRKPTIRKQIDRISDQFDRAHAANWMRCKRDATEARAGIR